MKRIIVLCLLFQIGFSSLYAQTLNEWVKQKKTQLQYLVQQIGALQVYGEYLHKGYAIAKHGLGAINNGKDDEFTLHKKFFSSLSAVNLSVKNDSQFADIILLQSQILLKYNQCKKGVRNSLFITETERDYISSVLDNLVAGCLSNLTNLTALTTEHILQLSDGERLNRIKEIHADMQDRYAFVSNFENDVSLLAKHRHTEQECLPSLLILYGSK